MLMQQPLGLVLADALAHRDQPVLGHQFGDRLAHVGGEAHVAVGQDADQLAGLAVAAALHHRNAGDVVLLHQRERVGERRVGMDGERVHHHAGFEFLHLRTWAACSCGSKLRWITPMPPACAMAIAIWYSVTVSIAEATIGMLRLISRVMLGADVHLGGQHVRQAGLEQHVVEGERLGNGRIDLQGHANPFRPSLGFCGLSPRAVTCESAK